MQKSWYKMMNIWFDEDYKYGSTRKQIKKLKRHHKHRLKKRLDKMFLKDYRKEVEL